MPTRASLFSDNSRISRSSSGPRQCPVGMDLAALGKKWTFHILRGIGMEQTDRFNRILRSLPGLTPRVLIMRLNELQECGLIQPITLREKPRLIRWVLTEKGRDTIPILQGYTSYVAKWYPNASLSNHRKEAIKYPTIPELIGLERGWNLQQATKK